VQAEQHTCKSTAERNKAELEDFWGIFNGTTTYVDKDFTADSSSLYWTDMDESNQGWGELEWKRASDEFKDHSLFGSEGVTPADVRQGSIGDCWFLSAISALSEVPGRIERVFQDQDNELSPNGVYAINFWTLGVPHTVIVDDFLPMQLRHDGNYYSVFTKMGLDDAIWAPILEKAFAKYHGNYSHIVGGDSRLAARTLSGAPYDTYGHTDYSKADIIQQLSHRDSNDELIQVNTGGNNNAY
jgi:hypothetical protein